MLELYTTGLTWITREGRAVWNPTFYLVDVFAEHRYAGNQLAAVQGATAFDVLVAQGISTGVPRC